ncbi:hypothetical protein BTUL_0047g00430 [Botrytis tulipae]|uniref:Heterokaryon incompatibility domain-containing protein n=1 Tax=Botrytis tulipae TaxID=87230 RepID=A0A4Z1F091_9HELO|nr:hypothetical protein BTUL_0047g00430 [Botrytis tulipae]
MQKVYGNGFSLRVRPNVHCALVHLREKTEPRMLWIDAICIDMQNFEERSFHLRLMTRLYSQAQEVIMWLGELRNSSETMTSEAKAMSVLNMDNLLDRSVTPYWKTWGPVDALFRRSLWSRAWMIQERHLSTDYRDKLYALLSLLGDEERSDPLLHPDYSLSFLEMASKLTVYVLKKYQNLTILESSYAADNSENLSSWTLDLYALRRPIAHESSDAIQQSTLQDSHDASQAYNAGGKYILDDPPFTFSSNLETLKVWGVVIDSVENCDLGLRLSQNIYWESSRGRTVAFNCRRFVNCLDPKSVKRDDLVVVLFGSIVPFLLRKIQVGYVQAELGTPGERYKLVGDCYVEGIMEGEILEAYQAGDNEGQEFWLE